MRRKVISIFVLVVMFLSVMSVGSAFATGETATATNMQIAEGKAAEIDTLVTVLWAYWMDELNAYNLHPDTEDPPQWTEDFNDLTDLPDTFPVEDYELHINGNNIDIHTTISEGLVEYLRVLLPLAAISDTGDVILTVVRPRAYLGSSIFVKRDGTTEDGGPTFMPNHTISFGQDINLSFEGDAVFNVPSGSTLSLSPGSLVDFSGSTLQGVNNLVYRGEELDSRFLNTAGDVMAGNMTFNGNVVYRGTELEDRFLNKMTGGTVSGPVEFWDTASFEKDVTYKGSELDSRYVNTTGDTMTGRLKLQDDLNIGGVNIERHSSGLNFTGPLYVNGKELATSSKVQGMIDNSAIGAATRSISIKTNLFPGGDNVLENSEPGSRSITYDGPWRTYGPSLFGAQASPGFKIVQVPKSVSVTLKAWIKPDGHNAYREYRDNENNSGWHYYGAETYRISSSFTVRIYRQNIADGHIECIFNKSGSLNQPYVYGSHIKYKETSLGSVVLSSGYRYRIYVYAPKSQDRNYYDGISGISLIFPENIIIGERPL